MAEAKVRLGQLATEALEAAMRKRQLAHLVAAVTTAEAEEEGLVDAAVVDKARALLAELETEPPRAQLAPAGR